MANLQKKGCIRVLQVLDKTGMRGAPLHGVTRLLLSWWPYFHDAQIDAFLCVIQEPLNKRDFDAAGVPVQYLGRKRFDPRTIIDLIRVVKRNRIQLMHCHGYGATDLGRVAGAICGVPVLVHEHMIDNKIPKYQIFADWLLAPLTPRAIAVTNAVRDFLIECRSVKPERIDVVYNAVSPDHCRTFTPEEQRVVAEHYKLPVAVPLVGIVGRLDVVKGHADFLNAAALVLAERRDAYFVIVGDGELGGQLKVHAQELGITDHVIFLGHCDHVFKVMALFDVLVVSSHSEGFSLVAAEAMALGKPVVGTAVGGVPEVVDDEKTGILVPAKNPHQLARGILRVLGDRELAETFGRNGQEKCRKEFLIPHAVDRLSGIYRELIK